ncbi:Aspartate aminotransferase family protein [Flavobacterium sp. 9AF]|uniref:aspartate aminotransferase family protein n=1 Tax=Flavobacterium sp. 9AF TaxID=2653142 RepID=UPI0012EF6363|nr:aminotransferase class III-fold pyridoxal phosphate-dependent enzyme [Flavobacterium sp. 9AF]VXC11809.1 Aspartate aminotransferase family protein [Flavobacterium sp. 9AF]
MKLFDVYPLFDLNFIEAEGSYLWNDRNEKHLDLYGGHAVISIGHSHPTYVKMLTRQLHNIGFYSNSVRIPIQEEVAKQLGRLSGYEDYEFFMCNSGAEANENALKLASFHTNKKKVICFTKAFHGRTAAAVAATDNKKIIAPINETDNFIFLPFNEIEVLEDAFKNNEIAAVIIEGIQGVGGVQIPTTPFLQKIRSLCDRYQALLILDEIQSGYGRTGKFFAHQHANIKADIVTVAKGMGNGFPVGGVIISPEIEAKHGLLGTTFGGNYLACAASKAVLEVMESEKLMTNAKEMGDYLYQQLKEDEIIKEIRYQGLMFGIELKMPCTPFRNQLLQDFRILTGNASCPNTLRILPALNISKKELDVFISAFKTVSKLNIKKNEQILFC